MNDTTTAAPATARLHEADLYAVVGYQVAQASITTLQVFADHVARSFDLRPVEFTVLALIDANPGVFGWQLAKALAVTPPNITMWVEKLEGRGLIERETSAIDRRYQHIRASAMGSELSRRATRQVCADERQALDGMTAAEIAMLIELLNKVARSRRR